MPTSDTATILAAALEQLAGARPLLDVHGCTLVAVALTNLVDAAALQLPLPFATRSRADLDEALDEVRERFGSTAIVRARLAGRPGIEMPVLPD